MRFRLISRTAKAEGKRIYLRTGWPADQPPVEFNTTEQVENARRLDTKLQDNHFSDDWVVVPLRRKKRDVRVACIVLNEFFRNSLPITLTHGLTAMAQLRLTVEVLP